MQMSEKWVNDDRTAQRWRFWPVVPIYPYGQRRTLMHEVVKDTLWTFDQVQGIFYVVVPVRMTVVRLKPWGLLVYSPVAPTAECVGWMRSLEAKYGKVRYILQTTTTGIEHKVFVGPFARQFPEAEVYVAPHSWSYPLNLPLSWLGLPAQRTRILSPDTVLPFGDQFEMAILGPIRLGLGPFVEVALFHRETRTLLLTDTLVSIPEEPPAILQQDPYPLLFHARDRATDAWVDTPAMRRRGWHRIALFAFYFQPSALAVPSLGEALRDAKAAPDRSRKSYFGLYPFCWQPGWESSFQALHQGGQPLVAPVLQTLILNRDPPQVWNWVEQVTQWYFERVIPCHLAAPIAMTRETFRDSFAFLHPEPLAAGRSLPLADVEFLQTLDAGLVRRGVTPPPVLLPSQPKAGRPD